MKRARRSSSNGMRPEYDFASMKGGVRGKYAKRLRADSNLVVLEPDLATAFPSDDAVNQMLRAALTAAKRFSKQPRARRRVNGARKASGSRR